MGGGVEFVEHPGELRLRLRAGSLGDLAAVAGRALAELELGREPGAGEGSWREISVSGRDREALLVNWVNELIYLAETECWIGVDQTVIDVTDRSLRMRVHGVTVEQAPSCVKAATLHGVTVTDVPGGVAAELVLDV